MTTTIPTVPRLLGSQLTGLKVLLLGTCQLEPLVNASASLGYKIQHLLMGSYRLSGFPAMDATNVDAAVVGLTLRQILRDAVGKPADLSVDTSLARISNSTEAIKLLGQCEALMDEMLPVLHDALKNIPTFFMAFHEPSFQYSGNLSDRYDVRSPKNIISKLNEHLYELTKTLTNFYFVDSNELLNFVGRMHLQDDVICASTHASFIGGFDFSNDTNRIIPPRSIDVTYESEPFKVMYGENLWNLIADNIKVLRQLDAVKLIIIDLDDTLWRGVAAEHSIPNYQRVEGWPLGFVEALLYFKSRGGLLAVASKNDIEPTLKRLDAIWQGAITSEDFVSIKINWEAKSNSIAAILSETNLLPESALFIDDNPREIDEVKSRFPNLRCLGGDHMDWRKIILRSPETQVAFVSAESKQRTELVRAHIERQALAKAMPREEWLASLHLEQRFFLLRNTTDRHFERGYELLNKTNQFNTTGKRWLVSELERFFIDGGLCLLTTLKDKTIDNGIVGTVLVCRGEIVQAVLSCRVFDLGADIFMGRVATLIALQNADKVVASIVDTGKNFSCHGYFLKLGFMQMGERFEVTTACESPKWISSAHSDISALLRTLDPL